MQQPLLLLLWLLGSWTAASAASIKSVQFWAEHGGAEPTEAYFQNWTTAPQLYVQSLEAAQDTTDFFGGVLGGTGIAANTFFQPVLTPDLSIARAALSAWTFLGCFPSDPLPEKMPDPPLQSGHTPLTCSIMCDEAGILVAVMQGTACFCLPDRSRIRGNKPLDPKTCDLPCRTDYFDGSLRLCGGPRNLVSVYQQWHFVHQTAQGCLDPWRFLWYQSVAVELPSPDEDGNVYQWYLHAASMNNGDAVFAYHQPIDSMLIGLQYDLDKSRIVGTRVPHFTSKQQEDFFTPEVQIYTINSLVLRDIVFTTTPVPYAFDDSDASNFLLLTGVSALDVFYNLYYVVMPVVPSMNINNETNPDWVPDYTSYGSMLYGINLNLDANVRVLTQRLIAHDVVALEVNSAYHDVFALVRERPRSGIGALGYFYYVRLGVASLNKLSLVPEFSWNFISGRPLIECVVNPFTYRDFRENVYQIGASAVDHISNTSYFAHKETRFASSPLKIEGINQRGFLHLQGLPELDNPAVQAALIVNADPRIPLTLAAPRLLFARFSMDSRFITVRFDASTVKGALPVDTDGDYLPDAINWEAQQIGVRNCSDMFARQTAAALGSIPATSCEWTDGSTILITLSTGFRNLSLGDPLYLKDITIFVYLIVENSWSMAANGGIGIGYPYPLLPPYIDVSFSENVDLCSPTTLNGEASYNHGDEPRWRWTLNLPVTCENGVFNDADITEYIETKLAEVSVGSTTHTFGSAVLTFKTAELQPGCTYNFNVSLSGRWGQSSWQMLKVRKNPIPAPVVSILGPKNLEITRATPLTIQTRVLRSACETLFGENYLPVFEWGSTLQDEGAGIGEIDTFVDVSTFAGASRGTIFVDRFNLQPQGLYNFFVKVGYAHNWNVPGASTVERVSVQVDRSNIRAAIFGGDRKVRQGKIIALDPAASVDPDYPDERVETNPEWSFKWRCTTPEGEPCFSHSNGLVLSDVRPCTITTFLGFQDLGRDYPVPSFPSDPFAGATYYCLDPNSNGALIINTGQYYRNNYTFTVEAVAHGRIAASSSNVEVIPADVDFPEVFIQAVNIAKFPTTQNTRFSGNLVADSLFNYGGTVQWSWDFFREEANPKYQAAEAAAAQISGTTYYEPMHIFLKADELDGDTWPESTFLSERGSNYLMIAANRLVPNNVYSLRLTATVPDPLNEGLYIRSPGDLKIETAGPPPHPGDFSIQPAVESYVDEQKTIVAFDWSAEDRPISYSFSYRSDLKNMYSRPTRLRVNPLVAPDQTVYCMRAGEPEDNYAVEVTAIVQTVYGAETSLMKPYRVLPPKDTVKANAALVALMAQAEPESSALIANCMDLSTSSEEQLDAIIDILASASDTGVVSTQTITANMAVLQTFADTGVTSLRMVDYAETVSSKATQFLDRAGQDGISDEERDVVASAIFVALGSLGVTSGDLAPGSAQTQARSVNALDPATGAYFPASSRGLRAGARRLGDRGRGDEDVTDEDVPPPLVRRVSRFNASLPSMAPAPRRLENKRSKRRRLAAPAAQDAGVANSEPWPVAPEAWPSFSAWDTLPNKLRPAQYRSRSRGRATDILGMSSTTEVEAYYMSMFEAQESLETDWLGFVGAASRQDSETLLRAVLDEEYFLNYSSQLPEDERESVLAQWYEQKAVREADEAMQRFKVSLITRKMLEQISNICGVLVKYMGSSGELSKEYLFPYGQIRIGKSRDLRVADPSLNLSDSQWTLPPSASGGYGFEAVTFTEKNPLAWSSDTVAGPFIVTALEVFGDDGKQLKVEKQTNPVKVLSEFSTYASAGCFYWDWSGNNGLGEWSRQGVLNNNEGCVSTHLSVVGIFLDPELTAIELPRGVATFLEEHIVQYNIHIIAGGAGAIALACLVHYWAFRQDGVDHAKPVEMRRLGDGIRGPRSQDDPVFYTDSHALQVLLTFRNILARDHLLAACFCRCPKLKVTRLQKVAVLSAMLSGTASVAALFYGERVLDPRHFIEIGTLAAVVTFPMVGALGALFATRPVRGGTSHSLFGDASPEASKFHGVLEALPIPDDERESEDDPDEEEEDCVTPASHRSLGATAPVSFGHLLAGGSAARREAWGSTGGSAEAGGGPVAPALPGIFNGAFISANTPATARVLMGAAPPAPPARGEQPGASLMGLPPLPPMPQAAKNARLGANQVVPKPPQLPPPGQPPDIFTAAGNPASGSGSTGGSGRAPPPAPPPAAPHGLLAAWCSPLPGELPTPPSPLAPLLPLAGRRAEDADAGGGVFAEPELSPAMPAPAESGAVEASQAQAQLLRRVRRMYIEKVIQNAERLAYDERVDLKSSAPHPMAQAANALAHIAVASYWLVALSLVLSYAVYFSSTVARLWTYAVLSGWVFTCLVLELVKVALSTILELSLLSQRKRLEDHRRLREKATTRKAAKWRQMEVAGASRGVSLPTLASGGARPPLPPEPPPTLRQLTPHSTTSSLPFAAGEAAECPAAQEPRAAPAAVQEAWSAAPAGCSSPSLGDASAG